MSEPSTSDTGTRVPSAGFGSPETALSLIRFDYEQSLRFIDGVVRISSTIRQTTIAAAVALIGVSIQSSSPTLGGAAAILAVTMGLMDAYHGWLYNEALRRVTTMESILRQAKSAQLRPDDEAVAQRLAEMIDDFKIGPLSELPKFRPVSLLSARPLLMYAIYALTAVGGILAAILC